MPAWRAKAVATVRCSGSASGSALRPRKLISRASGDSRGHGEESDAVGHHGLIGFAGAIPFEHGEFRVMQRAALAITEHPGELEDAALAGGKKLLAGELRGGVQVERHRRAVGRDELGLEGMEVRFVARRALQDRRLDLGEIRFREVFPQRRKDAPPRLEERLAVGMDVGHPPRRGSHRAP